MHNIHQILFKRCALTRGSIPHFESGLIKNKTKIKCLAYGVIWNLGQLSIECDFGIVFNQKRGKWQTAHELSHE